MKSVQRKPSVVPSDDPSDRPSDAPSTELNADMQSALPGAGALVELPALEDACTTGCPVARAASVIDGRWTTLIIRDLLPGKRRYSELLASLGGVSPKVLAERLRFLEAQGVVHKTTYPVVPPKTEYELTATGRKLEAVIQAMAAFGASLDAAGQG